MIDRYLTIPKPEERFPPRPNPCLTCPSPDLLEAVVLGGMIRSASELLHKDRIGIEAGLRRIMELSPDKFDTQLLKGAASGLKELQAMYANSAREMKQLLG